MAFDLATNSDGGIQTLVVCEEAHRYIPLDERKGFLPTRQAIARIAKEGRKYGVYLAVVTQRPGELDPQFFPNVIHCLPCGLVTSKTRNCPQSGSQWCKRVLFHFYLLLLIVSALPLVRR